MVDELSGLSDVAKANWYGANLDTSIAELERLLDRHVLVYYSAFLQKPDVPGHMTMMMPEDVNGLMAAFHGVDTDKGLAIVLHTPGGATMAVQTMVDYIRSKFDSVDVYVPTYAMSAGTMLALASDRIVLGRQSQLGPIDPQLSFAGRSSSARSIVEQFEVARREIVGDPAKGVPGNPQAAHLWAPIVGAMAPSLIQFAQDQLDFAEAMVADWLNRHMCAGDPDLARSIATYFNDASSHKSHDKRISYDDALAAGVNVAKLEDSQEIQEAVLTLYHVASIIADQTPTVKLISSGAGRVWLRSFQGTLQAH